MYFLNHKVWLKMEIWDSKYNWKVLEFWEILQMIFKKKHFSNKRFT